MVMMSTNPPATPNRARKQTSSNRLDPVSQSKNVSIPSRSGSSVKIKKPKPIQHRKIQIKKNGAWEKQSKMFIKEMSSGDYLVSKSGVPGTFDTVPRQKIWVHKDATKLAQRFADCKFVKKTERVSPPVRVLTLTPVVFKRPGCFGDYKWMIEQDQHKNSLFLYNDNYEQFFDQPDNLRAGGGNACVRPYKASGQAFGIPTGSFKKGGFRNLSSIKSLIDYTFHMLVDFMAEQEQRRGRPYDTLFFSSDDELGSRLGSGIFHVDADVLAYMTDCIRKIPRALYVKRQILRHMKAGLKFHPFFAEVDHIFHLPIVDKEGGSWNTLRVYNM